MNNTLTSSLQETDYPYFRGGHVLEWIRMLANWYQPVPKCRHFGNIFSESFRGRAGLKHSSLIRYRFRREKQETAEYLPAPTVWTDEISSPDIPFCLHHNGNHSSSV